MHHLLHVMRCLTYHVTFDISSVYYSARIFCFADLMRPSQAETSRLKLMPPLFHH